MKFPFTTSSLTIGHRIFLGFMMVLLIFASQAVVYVIGFEQAKGTFSDHIDHSRRVRAILDIERNIHELQGGVLAYTYSGYNGVAARVREMQYTLGKQLGSVRSVIDDQERRELLIQIEHHFRLYSETFETTVEERRERDHIAFEKLHTIGDEIHQLVIQHHQQLVERGDLFGADIVGNLINELLLAQREALLFIDRPNSRMVRQTNRYLLDMGRSLVQLRAHLEGDGHETDTIDRIEHLSSEYNEAFFGMVRATRAYMHLVYVVMGGEAAEIGSLARNLKQLSLDQQQQIEASIIESMRLSLLYAQLVVLFAIAIGLYLAWRIGNGIALPIRSITRALTSLARGRMEVDIPGMGRGDEIGAMAMAAHVFKERAHELANASRYKSEFLANMSHELRTPLNSMLILARVLADDDNGNLQPGQRESAQVIYDSGVDLLRLINDILDLTKIEAGRMELYIEERGFVSLKQLLERMFSPVAESKGLGFSVELLPGLPEYYSTDWGKLEQILRNFLANAFKFTASGQVSVTITRNIGHRAFMNSDLQADDVVAFEVSDSGIGIPPDKQEQIFEAFRQVDGSTSRKYGGTGLGLSISRRFADLLGGEIQVESREGNGATFTLFLPARPVTTERIAGTVTPHQPAGGEAGESTASSFQDHSRTILVVDDDRRNVFALKTMLKDRVGEILSANNGLDAIALLDEHPDTDLVLLDIMMPGIDGYQTMEQIRQQPRFCKLPIIALTARAMPGDRERCLSAGASDYLSKPVDSDQLLGTLRVWLNKPKLPIEVGTAPLTEPGRGVLPKVRILADQDPPTSGKVSDPLVDDGRPVRVLIVDDDMRNSFALTHALEGRVERVVMARDGQRALDELEKDPQISIVLMDIMMPVMDGYEAMRRIRANPAWSQLPILALTALAREDERQRCRDAGADDCLTKPVQLAELIARMRRLLGDLEEQVTDNE